MVSDMTSETPTFKVGDIVKLKSGGPKMTVVGIIILGYEKRFICGWFSPKIHYATVVLPSASLEPV